MPQKKTYTIKQAAEITGKPRSTINRWCLTGKLPSAHKRTSETGESYWVIFETDLPLLDNIKMGRPKKQE